METQVHLITIKSDSIIVIMTKPINTVWSTAERRVNGIVTAM